MQEVKRLGELREEYVDDDNYSEEGGQSMRQRYQGVCCKRAKVSELRRLFEEDGKFTFKIADLAECEARQGSGVERGCELSAGRND